MMPRNDSSPSGVLAPVAGRSIRIGMGDDDTALNESVQRRLHPLVSKRNFGSDLVDSTSSIAHGLVNGFVVRLVELRVGHRRSVAKLHALDLTDLGKTLRERVKLPKQSTMDRIARAKSRMGKFPAILMPAKALRSVERHPWQPMSTLTTQHETTLLSSGAIMVGAGNTFERPGSECRTRTLDEPLWTQTATNTAAVTWALMAAVVPFRAHTHATGLHQPMPTQTSQQVAALVSAVVPFRSGTLPTGAHAPMPTHTTKDGFSLLSAALVKQNGGPEDTGVRQLVGPLGALTTVPTETLIAARLDFAQRLADVDVLDMHWRMLKVEEVQAGQGFDPDFHSWGSSRDRVAGFGNAVPPPLGQWVAERVKEIL